MEHMLRRFQQEMHSLNEASETRVNRLRSKLESEDGEKSDRLLAMTFRETERLSTNHGQMCPPSPPPVNEVERVREHGDENVGVEQDLHLRGKGDIQRPESQDLPNRNLMAALIDFQADILSASDSAVHEQLWQASPRESMRTVRTNEAIAFDFRSESEEDKGRRDQAGSMKANLGEIEMLRRGQSEIEAELHSECQALTTMVVKRLRRDLQDTADEMQRRRERHKREMKSLDMCEKQANWTSSELGGGQKAEWRCLPDVASRDADRLDNRQDQMRRGRDYDNRQFDHEQGDMFYEKDQRFDHTRCLEIHHNVEIERLRDELGEHRTVLQDLQQRSLPGDVAVHLLIDMLRERQQSQAVNSIAKDQHSSVECLNMKQARLPKGIKGEDSRTTDRAIHGSKEESRLCQEADQEQTIWRMGSRLPPACSSPSTSGQAIYGEVAVAHPTTACSGGSCHDTASVCDSSVSSGSDVPAAAVSANGGVGGGATGACHWDVIKPTRVASRSRASVSDAKSSCDFAADASTDITSAADDGDSPSNIRVPVRRASSTGSRRGRADSNDEGSVSGGRHLCLREDVVFDASQTQASARGGVASLRRQFVQKRDARETARKVEVARLRRRQNEERQMIEQMNRTQIQALIDQYTKATPRVRIDGNLGDGAHSSGDNPFSPRVAEDEDILGVLVPQLKREHEEEMQQLDEMQQAELDKLLGEHDTDRRRYRRVTGLVLAAAPPPTPSTPIAAFAGVDEGHTAACTKLLRGRIRSHSADNLISPAYDSDEWGTADGSPVPRPRRFTWAGATHREAVLGVWPPPRAATVRRRGSRGTIHSDGEQEAASLVRARGSQTIAAYWQEANPGSSAVSGGGKSAMGRRGKRNVIYSEVGAAHAVPPAAQTQSGNAGGRANPISPRGRTKSRSTSVDRSDARDGKPSRTVLADDTADKADETAPAQSGEGGGRANPIAPRGRTKLDLTSVGNVDGKLAIARRTKPSRTDVADFAADVADETAPQQSGEGGGRANPIAPRGRTKLDLTSVGNVDGKLAIARRTKPSRTDVADFAADVADETAPQQSGEGGGRANPTTPRGRTKLDCTSADSGDGKLAIATRSKPSRTDFADFAAGVADGTAPKPNGERGPQHSLPHGGRAKPTREMSELGSTFPGKGSGKLSITNAAKANNTLVGDSATHEAEETKPAQTGDGGCLVGHNGILTSSSPILANRVVGSASGATGGGKPKIVTVRKLSKMLLAATVAGKAKGAAPSGNGGDCIGVLPGREKKSPGAANVGGSVGGNSTIATVTKPDDTKLAEGAAKKAEDTKPTQVGDGGVSKGAAPKRGNIALGATSDGGSGGGKATIARASKANGTILAEDAIGKAENDAPAQLGDEGAPRRLSDSASSGASFSFQLSPSVSGSQEDSIMKDAAMKELNDFVNEMQDLLREKQNEIERLEDQLSEYRRPPSVSPFVPPCWGRSA
eukprot:TRINITY_DN17323_c0_g1_i1.p1 TRINITY_DN17323_c0_g1~~TRINITY_DN17323_c0_g1_i1.p1  ORF type:complete len:1472 (-),score=300.66 TRINITY_DN17323_c0_g1_i1:109-4494(-)